MSRIGWSYGRVVGPAVILAVLIWRVGTGPFLAGVQRVDLGALAAAAGIGGLTTLCCAWRWKTVAGGLGVAMPLRTAVAAYYRSVFLNLTLPGGVIGDIHRGVSHGRAARDVGRAMRAVMLERFAGQLVQVLVTVVVLLALPSPIQSSMPWVAIAALGAVLGVALAARVRPERARAAWARLQTVVWGQRHDEPIGRRAWLGVTLASALVVAGHAGTFLIAARTAGTTAPPSKVLPLALLAMLAMVLPSVGGWGPREGVTAWVFGAAGLGAAHGVATGVVYGVIVLVASLPGAVVILVAWFRSTRHPTLPERTLPPPLRRGAAHA